MLVLRPYQFVDLALKSDKDAEVRRRPDGSVIADWFCIATASRVKALVYLLDLYRAQIPFPEQVKVLVREHHNWHSSKIGIENHGYQWALGQAAWDKFLPVFPVTYPGDKVYKWQLGTPHFESGRVRIRGVKEPSGELIVHPAFKRFMVEAMDAPYGESDDTLDAVTGVVLMCTGPEFTDTEFVGGIARGFSIMIAGGTGRQWHIGGRRGDQFDVFPSEY